MTMCFIKKRLFSYAKQLQKIKESNLKKMLHRFAILMKTYKKMIFLVGFFL
jgi:hypothetical protein